MKIKTLLAIALMSLASSAFADIADGTVLAYDRVAKILVFTDKSVWSLEILENPVPKELKVGDRVEVSFESDEEDGLTVVHSIRIII